MVTGEFLLYFENPFWVGLFLRSDESGAFAARHIFNGEPSYPEIQEFLLYEYESLVFLKISDSEMEYLIQKQNRLSHRQVKKNRSEIPKSLDIYKNAYQQEKKNKQKVSCRKVKENAQDLYLKKREKARLKKRGR